MPSHAELPETERTQLVANVTSRLQATRVQIDPLVDNARFGVFNMRVAREPLLRVRAICDDLATVDLNRLPTAGLQDLNVVLTTLAELHKEIEKFNGATGGQAAYDSLIARARELDNRVAIAAAPWVGFAAGRDRGGLVQAAGVFAKAQQDASNLQQQAHSLRTEYENLVEYGRQELGRAIKDAREIVREMRAASAKAGVTAHSAAFNEAAERYRRASWYWLAATIVTAGCSVVGLVLWLHKDPIPAVAANGAIAQEVLTRSVVILFGVFLTVWTSRNYRAQRHLHVLNDHRARALNTFGTFADATADDATKDAILLETTRSIFSAGGTGYQGGGDDDSGADRLLAAAKMLAGKGD